MFECRGLVEEDGHGESSEFQQGLATVDTVLCLLSHVVISGLS